MSKAPEKCAYCAGDDPNCGFCEMGVPLDTQADWDASWGAILRTTDTPIRKTPRSER